LNKGYSAKAVRYLLLSVHYRQQLNFTFESLEASTHSVEKINDFYRRMADISEKEHGNVSREVFDLIEKAKKDFENALDSDLNISEALAALFEFMGEINSREDKLSGADAKEVIAAMDSFDSVLGLIDYTKDELEPQLQELVNKREEARKSKNFALADKLRDELRQKGIQIDDSKDGFRWKRLKKL